MNIISIHSPYKLEDYKTVDRPSPEAWDWCMENKNGDIHIFDEGCLQDHIKYDGKIKIALFGEVPAIYEYAKQFDPNNLWVNPYDWIKKNHQHFNYIMSHFTFLKDIIGKEKFIWTSVNQSHIRKENYGLYEKDRLLSIVASHKKWTSGHKLRHEVIAKYGKYIDVYGSGYNSIINDYDVMGKIIAIAPYYFNIVVLNTNIDDWFDTQTTDDMAVGTIPIFCGTKNVTNYFNPDGIIQFNSVEELEEIIPTLNKELYQSKMSAILENLGKAKYYSTTQDWLYHNKKEFLENLKI